MMYRENYVNALREELLEIVADHLTPVALRYGYSEVPLETNIKWRPLVLVLGNYSSGKSTLINEFLGADIQDTGQAPTDDSFTVITYDDAAAPDSPVRVTEQRDGKYLLNDPEYPFEGLKKHGQRFAAHFRLKKVNAPFLKNMAIIDTPGMLDSVSERDRGYNYQEVIGDLAQNADLVLVIFDPHKAGTGREAHASLRDTLPSRTFEDRLLFVLNRVDECASLIDLIRVYGTLCWNLSQMTGRKDIPMIRLTYSPRAGFRAGREEAERDMSFLKHLENQREELKEAVLQAPRYRLDNLASFVETHAERLSHFLEALIQYRKDLRTYRAKCGLMGFFASLMAGGGALLAGMYFNVLGGLDPAMQAAVGAGVFFAAWLFWMLSLRNRFAARYHRRRLADLDTLTVLENQTRRDTWSAIREAVGSFLDRSRGKYSLADVRQDYARVRRICEEASREIREALSELSSIGGEEPEAEEATLPEESAEERPSEAD